MNNRKDPIWKLGESLEKIEAFKRGELANNERIQEIKKNVDFNYYWWFAANEGEPLCQDELDNVKELVKHAAYLLSEVERIQAENKAMKEALEQIDGSSMSQFANLEDMVKGIKLISRKAISHLKGE